MAAPDAEVHYILGRPDVLPDELVAGSPRRGPGSPVNDDVGLERQVQGLSEVILRVASDVHRSPTESEDLNVRVIRKAAHK
jgi:hypothetical protein